MHTSRLLSFLSLSLLAVAPIVACMPPPETDRMDGGRKGTGGTGTTSPGSGGAMGGTPTGSGGSVPGTGGTNGGSGAGSGGRMGSGGSGSGGSGMGLGGSGGSSGGSGGSSGSGGRAQGASGGATGSGGRTGSGGSGSGGMGMGSGGSGSGGSMVVHPPRLTSGMNGWGSRYWDCCKPSCGWKGNVRAGNPTASCDMNNMSLGGNYDARSSCESGGTAYMCWNESPWALDDKLSYGFVAKNDTCGRCFQLQFTGTSRNGDSASTQPLNGKTMIVQVTNAGAIANDQMDILIPGGGVGLNPNACKAQWGSNDLGATYGGFLTGCNGNKDCVRQKCQTLFANKPQLLAGCNWFLGWFNAADNPNFIYQRIACPAGITQVSGLQDPG